MSLHIRTMLPEPLLFAHTMYGTRRNFSQRAGDKMSSERLNLGSKLVNQDRSYKVLDAELSPLLMQSPCSEIEPHHETTCLRGFVTR